MSVNLTGSKSLVGVAGVASEIQKEKKGREVYVMLSFLVGILEVYLLSTDWCLLGLRKCWEISVYQCFTDVTRELMAEKDPVAASAQKYKPIQSSVPGTTLGPIQINAFLGGGKLYDTSGVHLHHRQAAVVHSEDRPSLAPQSWLRAQSYQYICFVYSTKNMIFGFSIPAFPGGL
ncbi:putative nitric-oxide synthase (NADPH) [Rosa chinensis]|uniref:Putative nitric-oxide synthase (NADPH) n=1 Tax=Rosa chinensis TaxID=74649 RepID=A0A2P6SM77_ROSCH|nr:putative nitric-oxide synthase (NADPH) [Rosa chinensis]